MGFITSIFGGGGGGVGGKETTETKVTPWIPSQSQFNQFQTRGQQLMSPQFRQSYSQAQGDLSRAQGAIGLDPTFRATAGSQSSSPLMEGRFNQVTGQNAPGLTNALSQAISGAQTPQYAQGAQETWQSMLDPNQRSDAWNQVRQNVANDVMSNINTTFGGAGMSGSTLHQQNLAKGLTAGLANVENQAFQQALDRALQTAGVAQSDLQNQRAFGLGAAQAGQNVLSNQFGQNLQAAGARQGAYESGLERQLNAAQGLQNARAQQFGQNLALGQQRAGLGGQYQDVYGGNILNLMNTATGNAARSTSQSYNPGLLDYAQTGLQIGSLFSDRRLKQDIKRVGELDNGTPVYSYRYKDVPELGLSSDQIQVGVMSDEVDPSLVVKDASGFDRVNYGAL